MLLELFTSYQAEGLNPFFIRSLVQMGVQAFNEHLPPVLIPSSSGRWFKYNPVQDRHHPIRRLNPFFIRSLVQIMDNRLRPPPRHLS